MNGDNEKENLEEDQFNIDSDHSKEDLVEELIEIEGKLINEALNLIEHGLSLVDTQDYDDAIDILQQALGLYDQIGRINEMNLIRKKISEISLLKEQEVMEEKDQIESVKSIELLVNEKLEQAKNLIEIYEFDEAILVYDDAIQFYREMNNDSKIEGVYELIDKCYDQKAKFLIHGPKGEVSEAGMKSGPETSIEPVSVEQKKSTVDGVRVQKVKEYEKLRLREQLISNRAYELIENASKFVNIYDFEKATKLYNDAINYFKDINWEHEIVEIQKVIQHLEKNKEDFLHKVEEKREKDEKRRELEAEKVALLERKAMKVRELEDKERMKRVEDLEKKKQEKEAFQKEISKMVDNAEKIAREYELEKREAIKKGQFNVESCKYPEIIEIYKKVKQILIEKKWFEQASIYSNQIKLYEVKYENDKKLYEMELRKKEKDKEYQESLKIKKDELVVKEKLESIDEKLIEDEIFQKEIDEMVNKAERIAREYEQEIKKMNFDIKCKYPEVIEIYKNIHKKLVNKELLKQAEMYTNQIKICEDKQKRDEKLREVEARKIEKQREYEESLKVRKRKIPESANLDQTKLDKFSYKDELKREVIQKEISTMVDKALRLAREYESAVRRGNTELENPYSEVIEIYTKVKEMVLEIGLDSQVAVYDKQIQLYKKKL